MSNVDNLNTYPTEHHSFINICSQHKSHFTIVTFLANQRWLEGQTNVPKPKQSEMRMRTGPRPRFEFVTFTARIL